MADPDRRTARYLARRAVETGEPTRWFEELYANAPSLDEGVSWADLEPNSHLTGWGAPDALRHSRTLVVGCGYGDDAEWLAEQGHDVTAFDIAPTAVKRCQDRFPNSRVSYVVADLLDPPVDWLRERFDLVVEIYTIQVLPPDSDTRALAVRRLAELTGDTLFVIARGRDESEDPGEMPWPVTRAELEPLTRLGLTPTSFEDYFDDEYPPVRRFRATYRCPSPSHHNGFSSRSATP
jgi:SAM-dependent methyltransferase